MAIEFKCPFCNAMIRVPDNAGGGKGRCPKCAMRISVPKKSAPKPAAKSPVDDEPFVLPVEEAGANAETSESPPPAVFNSPAAVVDSAALVFDPAGLNNPHVGEFPVKRSAPIGSVARRLKKWKRGNSSWIIAAVIILSVLAAGYYVYPQLLSERLSGDFMAGSAETLELPSALIEKSRFKLPPDDVAMLLTKLEVNPVPLNSNSMLIQLAGTEKGLQISIWAGRQSHFYRVKLTSNDAVEKYLSRHASELESQRLKHVDQAATEFLVEYEKVLSKKSTSESITTFRDSLALASLVGGFGHELVAEYGRGLYRCAYEDRDGGLYFLLPEGAREFKVIGRKHTDGSVVVPAEFHVKVQGEIAQVKKSDEKNSPKPAKKEPPKKEGKDEKMDDDEMTGTK